MNRGNFLRLIATLVVAPSVLGEVTIKPKENIPPHCDRIRIYTEEMGKVRLRDLIRSDMHDVALITFINYAEKYFEARPVIYGKYKYKNIKDFRILANAFVEK